MIWFTPNTWIRIGVLRISSSNNDDTARMLRTSIDEWKKNTFLAKGDPMSILSKNVSIIMESLFLVRILLLFRFSCFVFSFSPLSFFVFPLCVLSFRSLTRLRWMYRWKRNNGKVYNHFLVRNTDTAINGFSYKLPNPIRIRGFTIKMNETFIAHAHSQ